MNTSTWPMRRGGHLARRERRGLPVAALQRARLGQRDARVREREAAQRRREGGVGRRAQLAEVEAAVDLEAAAVPERERVVVDADAGLARARARGRTVGNNGKTRVTRKCHTPVNCRSSIGHLQIQSCGAP
jgi:hypothetical protein